MLTVAKIFLRMTVSTNVVLTVVKSGITLVQEKTRAGTLMKVSVDSTKRNN